MDIVPYIIAKTVELMMDLDHKLAYFLYHVSNSNPDYEKAWR